MQSAQEVGRRVRDPAAHLQRVHMREDRRRMETERLADGESVHINLDGVIGLLTQREEEIGRFCGGHPATAFSSSTRQKSAIACLLTSIGSPCPETCMTMV